VEAADDICYLVIDLEDAARMKVISIDMFTQLIAPILGPRLDTEKLNLITDDNQRIGLLRAMAINQLVQECSEVFKQNEKAILAGEFDQPLSDLIPSAPYTEEISTYSIKHIYNSQHVLEIQAAGFEVLPGLLSYFLEAVEDYKQNGKKKCSGRSLNAVRMLPEAYINEPNAYLRTRHIIDYISGMTDRHAVNFFRKIKGISL
jgi:dGTPase